MWQFKNFLLQNKNKRKIFEKRKDEIKDTHDPISQWKPQLVCLCININIKLYIHLHIYTYIYI